jgi:hypothetical protein
MHQRDFDLMQRDLPHVADQIHAAVHERSVRHTED